MGASARQVVASLLAVFACSAACRPTPDAGFAGTWVLTVEGRSLWVLTLEPEDGRYAGTLERPRRMTSDGRTFSGIGHETTKEHVTSGVPHGDMLSIVSVADDDSSDKQQYELRLTSPGEARLGIPEAPDAGTAGKR